MPDQSNKLSESSSAKRWVKQFKLKDRGSAAALIDRLDLFNETEVSNLISRELADVDTSDGRVALYAEREIAEATAFPIEEYEDAAGTMRTRAVPGARFKAVNPRRGSPRVGSEGMIAFLISQTVKSNARFVNHPSPKQYLSKNRLNRIHKIVIVTDFIGSGDRIWTMLEKFWRVPTFAAWWSRGYVRFHIVAAAGTNVGIARIKSHACGATVGVSQVVSTLTGSRPKPWAASWLRLANLYGKGHAKPLGHKDSAALVAFEYGMPNNVPAILGQQFSGWKPLFKGRAPEDLRPFFGLPPTTWKLLRNALEHRWSAIKRTFEFRSRRREKAEMLAFLLALPSRWHTDAEIEVAERAGLLAPDVVRLHKAAKSAGWISDRSRLTDSGRKLLKAGTVRPKKLAAVIAGSSAPYYPTSLRVS